MSDPPIGDVGPARCGPAVGPAPHGEAVPQSGAGTAGRATAPPQPALISGCLLDELVVELSLGAQPPQLSIDLLSHQSSPFTTRPARPMAGRTDHPGSPISGSDRLGRASVL